MVSNIQIEHGNFTVDRVGATFFTLNHESQTLIEKNSSGSVIFNYLIDASILEVQSLQYDGVYFWSLEDQGVGFRVRRWEISSSNVLTKLNEFSFANEVINTYDVNALGVESYSDSLDNQEVAGTTEFDVVDGGTVEIGDRIVVGPSTAVGFEGLFSSTTVIGKPTATTLQVSPALDKTFSPADPVFFTRSFFVFSDTAPAGLDGALYKYRAHDGFPLALNVSNMFNGVTAATFFSNKLLFVRGGEVIWLNPESQSIFKSQAIDILNEARTEYHISHDLTGFSNTIYRLEQQRVFPSGGGFDTEEWAPLFNYNTSGTVPEIYFIAVKADPPMVHKVATGIPADETKSTITVTVLDQFRTPVFNRIVDLTSDGGPLSSIQETTDINGQIQVEYTADSSFGEVTITAEVT